MRAGLQRSALTLPSKGHATAGHDRTLRARPCRRRMPLTSNVRALRMPSLFSHVTKLQPLAGASRRAAQSALLAAEPVLVSQLHVPVRASTFSHWSSLASSQSSSLPLARAGSGRPCMHHEHGHVSASPTRALRAGVLRRAVSVWSRLSAAGSVFLITAGCHRSGGSLAPHLLGKALPHHQQRPNPSVNRTSNIRLRLLSAAGYLER